MEKLETNNSEKNVNYTRIIRSSEVRESLKMMKICKTCSPDGIPIEIWKCLGDMEIN